MPAQWLADSHWTTKQLGWGMADNKLKDKPGLQATRWARLGSPVHLALFSNPCDGVWHRTQSQPPKLWKCRSPTQLTAAKGWKDCGRSCKRNPAKGGGPSVQSQHLRMPTPRQPSFRKAVPQDQYLPNSTTSAVNACVCVYNVTPLHLRSDVPR